ncbi:MAG: phosphoribosylamine--glycine ligase [Maricaulaceae bacterium]|jgi:phosphoribosylamine--glycine ligase
MNILLVGGGGREHALAWKIAQSPLVSSLLIAPGNSGTEGLALASDGRAENVAVSATDVPALLQLAQDRGADLVVVGPEAPLELGLADALRAAGIATFGPDKVPAQLETSKAFAKDFMRDNAIPTALYGVFTDAAEAKACLDRFTAPYVIKADGLAAGKGVVVAATRAEAEATIDEFLGGRFGAASARLVVEEFMSGQEASFFAFIDGETAVPLAAAQDHKRAFDGDEGPNTGGMGAYSPTPVFTDAEEAQVMETVVVPTAHGLARAGTPYRGVLYVGLMMTEQGPKVVEYNVRFGDPECQILMLRMKSDIVPHLQACADGTLGAQQPIEWDPRSAVTVVMAAEGYPGAVEKGRPITGVDTADALDDVSVFHAGAAMKDDALVTSGGRVLNVCALGDTLQAAVDRAYEGVAKISWLGAHWRTDIAKRAL